MIGAIEKSYIIFDLGGVLIEWDPRHLFRKLFNGNFAEMEYFLTHICSPSWNHQMDMGRPFDVTTKELAEDHPQYAELIHAYSSRWEEMVPYAIEDTVTLLQDLHRLGSNLGALSNWSYETFPLMRRRFSFLELFDPLIISGEVGVTKPDPAIYNLLLTNIGRDAQDCLFIDDSIANVEVARQIGFQTIHFRSAAELRRDLFGS